MNELKACPNCGASAYTIRAMSQYRICCHTPGCRMTGWHKAKRGAKKEWNHGADGGNTNDI